MSWRLFRFPVGYSCIVFCCLYVIFLAACLHLVVHFTACTLDKSKELRKTIPGFLECFNTCYVHKQTWQKCERQCIHTSAVPLSLCVCWHMDVTVKCRMKPGRIVIFISHFNVHMVFITVGESGTEFRKKKKKRNWEMSVTHDKLCWLSQYHCHTVFPCSLILIPFKRRKLETCGCTVLLKCDPLQHDYLFASHNVLPLQQVSLCR